MKHSHFVYLAQWFISLLLALMIFCVWLCRSVYRLRRTLEILHDRRYLVLKQARISYFVLATHIHKSRLGGGLEREATRRAEAATALDDCTTGATAAAREYCDCCSRVLMA